VPFAGEQDRVAVVRGGDRGVDGLRPVVDDPIVAVPLFPRLDSTGLDLRQDQGRILQPRIFLGDDEMVRVLRVSGGELRRRISPRLTKCCAIRLANE